MNRRLFLQSAVGGVMSIPFLPSLFKDNIVSPVEVPPRVVFLVGSFGQQRSQFFPYYPEDAFYGGSDVLNIEKLDTDSIKNTSHLEMHNRNQSVRYKKLKDIPGSMMPDIFHKGYSSYYDKMNILAGLDLINGQGHNNHSCLSGSIGVPNNPNDPLLHPLTIDNMLGLSQKVHPSLPLFDVMNFTMGPRNYSWYEKSGLVVNRGGARGASPIVTEMFASVSGGERADSKIIDLVLEDRSKLLKNKRLSQEDRYLIENYFQTLSELQQRMKLNYSSCTGIEKATNTNFAGKYNDITDTIVTAFQCGMSNVATVNLNSEVSGSIWHSNSHKNDQTGTYQEKLKLEKNIGDNIFLNLMKKMDSIIEVNGKTMLDNSLIVWTDELSLGVHHRGECMPIATAGGLNGKINQGYFVDYRQRPIWSPLRSDFGPGGRLYNQFLVTIAQACGLTRDDYSFGLNLEKGGIGEYDKVIDQSSSLQAVYNRYRGAERNSPLPFYYN
jgi:hypothetical protein